MQTGIYFITALLQLLFGLKCSWLFLLVQMEMWWVLASLDSVIDTTGVHEIYYFYDGNIIQRALL